MAGQSLSTELRRRLEKTIRDARQIAEAAARDAIRRLGVAEASAPTWLNDADKALRRRLRAHARSLGDAFDRATERQEVEHLIGAAAYAHWHRMLFARFLAERDLLRHPEHDVAVSLADCDELAIAEGLPDRWAAAERYAAAMLPGVFLPEDPVLGLQIAPEHTHRLQSLVQDLDRETFLASDSLGWTYQFWRGAEKDAMNKSGVKIGADELPAVTQLFTEPYMVRFLLHNTLGAWWAGKVLAQQPDLAADASDEATLRAACALPGVSWDMLRFVRENNVWRPAAGTFPSWPNEAKTVTLLDPCCGSGHFLTEALPILATLRQAQEGLSAADAIAGVLRDNLFGLEIDGRCVQIAAFAVAITAWAVGGWQNLPQPHIAWVGAPPPLSKPEFKALADGDADLEAGLSALHDLFSQAPILGSLIEPTGGDLMSPQRLGRIEPLLDKLLTKARRAEPETAEGAIAARGMADAALLLSRKYTLQATNVPFLGRLEQTKQLVTYIDRNFAEGRADLSTAMLLRQLSLMEEGGSLATVTKQEWCFLTSYTAFRRHFLNRYRLDFVVFLGEEAWVAFGKRGPLATLSTWSDTRGGDIKAERHFTCDATKLDDIEKKQRFIATGALEFVAQSAQLANPDSRITAKEGAESVLLEKYSRAYQGISTGDADRYRHKFWENEELWGSWRPLRSTTSTNTLYSGCENIVYWGQDRSHFAAMRGQECFGRIGVALSQMRHLPASLYFGEAFDGNVSAVVPSDQSLVAAIFEYMSSPEYKEEVRKIDLKKNVTNATLAKVPIDIKRWKALADAKYPDGLPEPYSNDPTQWLFHGHPAAAEAGTALHVALARLAGYRWPAESDTEMRLSAEARAWIAKLADLPGADDDGILCVPAVAGERPLAERLRTFLAAAFGDDWSEVKERQLITETDERFEKKAPKDQTLEGWLRDRAFKQHCKLFHDRPFLWQVWDGMKDGFSAFLHYHRLDQATMRKLTYTTLGDWLSRAKAEGSVPRQEKGRELQQELEKVLEGDTPYDIFVRWKTLAEQPLGWDPDLDDGVRMNIRPFITARILRDIPNIKWGKDRGADVPSAPWYDVHGGERINDHHTTLAEKRAARGEN